MPQRPNFVAPAPTEDDGPPASVLRIEAGGTARVETGHAAGRAAERAADRAAPPVAEPSAATARRRLSVQGEVRTRRPPSEHEQARRRLLLLWTKWLLPLGALVLLGSIAAWPELDRAMNAGRTDTRAASAVNLDTGRMLGARYRGLDAHNRPYMITADEARQINPDRIDLVRPIADTLTQNGTWILIRARSGVYMPHSQILDLYDHVVLYRDDGTLMHGPTATVDIKRGIVASNDWVHAEGPFGVLDAQGDLLSQRDGVAQFRGPGRLILNDDHTAHPATMAHGGAAR